MKAASRRRRATGRAPRAARSGGSRLAVRVKAVAADITKLAVDAIVNAADEALSGGGGIDAAIHRAAGQGLPAACRRFDSCPTGEVRLTSGFDLPARWVIHTVGPVWRGGDHGEDAQLARCYRHALWLASAIGARSVAIPAISTGVYRFPVERAAGIAARETNACVRDHPEIERVLLVCHGSRAMEAFTVALAAIA